MIMVRNFDEALNALSRFYDDLMEEKDHLKAEMILLGYRIEELENENQELKEERATF